MPYSPYDRTARDKMAQEIFINAMSGAVALGDMSPGEQEALYDQVADISLAMANRFMARAWTTPT